MKVAGVMDGWRGEKQQRRGGGALINGWGWVIVWLV